MENFEIYIYVILDLKYLNFFLDYMLYVFLWMVRLFFFVFVKKFLMLKV